MYRGMEANTVDEEGGMSFRGRSQEGQGSSGTGFKWDGAQVGRS
jgi:hypothetical protein